MAAPGKWFIAAILLGRAAGHHRLARPRTRLSLHCGRKSSLAVVLTPLISRG